MIAAVGARGLPANQLTDAVIHGPARIYLVSRRRPKKAGGEFHTRRLSAPAGARRPASHSPPRYANRLRAATAAAASSVSRR